MLTQTCSIWRLTSFFFFPRFFSFLQEGSLQEDKAGGLFIPTHSLEKQKQTHLPLSNLLLAMLAFFVSSENQKCLCCLMKKKLSSSFPFLLLQQPAPLQAPLESTQKLIKLTEHTVSRLICILIMMVRFPSWRFIMTNLGCHAREYPSKQSNRYTGR